jgi:hypothetical protein
MLFRRFIVSICHFDSKIKFSDLKKKVLIRYFGQRNKNKNVSDLTKDFLAVSGHNGATTLGIMAFSIMALSITMN